MATQQLRSALESYGFKPTTTVVDPNLFDSWVEAAVIAFQKGKGLTVDGIVGPQTWGALLNNSTVTATQPLAPASPNTPATQSDPGKLPTSLGSGISKPSDKTMMGLTLLLCAGLAWWMWTGTRGKKGGTYAGLPFGLGSADEADEETDAAAKNERIRARRRAAQRMQRIDMALEVELKRLEVDRVKQPGQAQALTKRIEKAIDAEDRVLERAPKGQMKSKPGGPMYKKETAQIGRRAAFAPTNPTLALRNRTEHEDDRWLERVENAKGAAGTTKRIPVSSRRYHTDQAYRESVQDDARQKADATKSRVLVVNEGGRTLFEYMPNVRQFKDVTSERLIDAVASDAKKGNCPKAVRSLYRVSPLATDPATRDKLDVAARLVAQNCGPELKEEGADRAEIRNEAARFTPDTAVKRDVKAMELRTYKRKVGTLTPDSIRAAYKRKEITEDVRDRLLEAHAREQAMRFEPARGTAKVVRRRKGERDAHIFTSPSGSKRTIRR